MRRSASFRRRMEALSDYDAIVLSDIGANTLLLHPDTWIHSKTTPNRLRLLRDYVRDGGGLLMFGGYYSFQGINGGARYHKTPVEEVLPVTCLSVDDRVEVPEGFAPVVTGTAEPSDPARARFGLAGPARLQRGDGEGRRRSPGHRVVGLWIAAAARHRPLRQGPHGRLDIRCRAALAAAALHRLERLQDAVRTDACLGDRQSLTGKSMNAGIKINGDRLLGRLERFAAIGGTPAGGVNRQALSAEDRLARAELGKLAADRGFAVFQDSMANLFIRRSGHSAEQPPFLIGSHLDSQPMGGRFDGALGTLAAFEVLESLDDANIHTPIAVEVVAWTNEEGSRFAPGAMGSMAFSAGAIPERMVCRRDPPTARC